MRLSISGVIASSILPTLSGGGSSEPTTTTTEYPTAGTVLSVFCVGYDQWAVFADGSGGTYDGVFITNSADCGWEETTTTEPPPSYGTFLNSSCSGYDLIGYYADGSGGSYSNVIAYNSIDCGYTAEETTTTTSESHPAYGTPLGTFCEGYDLMESFADGNGGTYSVLLESNASACGYA